MSNNYSQYLKHPVFKVASQIVTEQNLEAYVIGGFVRDLILERPSKDIDIVVIGNGLDLAKACADKLRVKKVSVFERFGTAQFVYKDLEVEFVGARKESYRSDSRKPTIENGTLQDDQNRRDFSINALAISLHKDNFGDLIDPFGEMEDIENEIIRTPLEPAKTYSDDPLRMMRAIRFATQLDFKIERKSLEAISENAHRLEIISQERIMDELNKIILSKTPSRGFKLLNSTKLLHQFFPEMIALQGIETRDGKSHKDNFYHTLQVLDQACEKTNDLWVRWAAILHDIAKPPTKRFVPGDGWTFHGHEDKGSRMVKPIFKRLKLPLGENMRKVVNLVKLHLRPIALTKEYITDSAVRRIIFDADQDLEDLMILCKSDITTKNKKKEEQFQANLLNVESNIAAVEERDRIRNWQPPIGGEEIMKIFGIGPSKEIGAIKTKLKDAILDGDITNDYTEAYKFVHQLGKELGLQSNE